MSVTKLNRNSNVQTVASFMPTHTHKHVSLGKPAALLPWALPLANQEAPGVARWAPADSGLGQHLPQVGQAGVVPQSLCEGLGSFIPDLIAPHPEGRGETVRRSARCPVPSAAGHAGRPRAVAWIPTPDPQQAARTSDPKGRVGWRAAEPSRRVRQQAAQAFGWLSVRGPRSDGPDMPPAGPTAYSQARGGAGLQQPSALQGGETSRPARARAAKTRGHAPRGPSR